MSKWRQILSWAPLPEGELTAGNINYWKEYIDEPDTKITALEDIVPVVQETIAMYEGDEDNQSPYTEQERQNILVLALKFYRRVGWITEGIIQAMAMQGA